MQLTTHARENGLIICQFATTSRASFCELKDLNLWVCAINCYELLIAVGPLSTSPGRGQHFSPNGANLLFSKPGFITRAHQG